MRRDNMPNISVYLKDREEKLAAYNDCNRNRDQRKRYNSVMASIAFSLKFHQDRKPGSARRKGNARGDGKCMEDAEEAG